MIKRALFVSMLLALAATSSRGQGAIGGFDRDQITIVVPAFNGPEDLGKAVASIMKLQISGSFRLRDPDRPEANLGRGAAVFIPAQMENLSAREAERLARVNGAEMTLWGASFMVGKGGVAQASITVAGPYLDFRQRANERWSIQFQNHELSVDIPRSTVDFPLITLSESQVNHYSSPRYLTFCKTMTGEQCVQGTEAETFRILEWTTNQVVKVRLNREDWYLQVPMLDENQSQAIDFSSGLMAYFRGDWNLVLSRMAKILETRRGVELKTDARVYRGAAKYRLGFSGEDEFRLAEELSPFNAQVAQYRVVGLLLDAIRASPSSRQRIVLGAMSYIKRKEKLFSSDDPWLSSARALAELLVASP